MQKVIEAIIKFIEIEYPKLYPDFLKFKFKEREKEAVYYEQEIGYKLNAMKELEELIKNTNNNLISDDELFKRILHIYIKDTLVHHFAINALENIIIDNNLNDKKVEFVSLFKELFNLESSEIKIFTWMNKYIKLFDDIKHYKTNKGINGPKINWEILTFYPFLLHPDKHLFLKPGPFKNFVKFLNKNGCEYTYSPYPTTEKYKEILEIVDVLREKLNQTDYKPKDMIDLQTFIFVMNDVVKKEKPQITKGKIVSDSDRESRNNNKNRKPFDLNTILYGPPGTGKTYNTINYAVAIIENKSFEEIQIEDYLDVKKRFEEYKKTNQIKFITFHQSYGYEDFIEGIKAETNEKNEISYKIKNGIFKDLCEKAKEKEGNYIIIIDEINRGNISKIFGELITLIEDDKRLGIEHSISVTLPYSKEEFGVPDNLYIIGTMNTSDRSIALLDTALRRRFSFIEMMPAPDLLDFSVNEINIKKLLSKINERIEFLYDRDHTIGHSYFIKLKDLDEDEKYSELCKIFQNKIIPLLQEYFYDDLEKIQLIFNEQHQQLGLNQELDDYKIPENQKRLIQSKTFKKDSLGFNNDDYEDKITFRVNPYLENAEIDEYAFIKIYSNQ